MEWISVKDELPNHGQNVAFVAVSPLRPDSHVNGRVLGGRYDAQVEAFSIPGACFDATYWMPLPPTPQGG